MAYYPNKQPPQKTRPLMGGNPQMTVGGYKNPSQLGPTTPGPVSGTMAPNQGGSGPSGQQYNPVTGAPWVSGGQGGPGYSPGPQGGGVMPPDYDFTEASNTNNHYPVIGGSWGSDPNRMYGDFFKSLGSRARDYDGGSQGGPQANRSGYSPKPYPQPKPGPYRQDPNAPMYKALRSAMYQQKQPNEGLPSGWGKTMDERNMPRMGPRQAGAYNDMFVGRPAGGGSGRFSPQEGAMVADWWNMQKQARDNGTYTGYNTGLDDYRQRWGQGNTSALGLLQALNQRSR